MPPLEEAALEARPIESLVEALPVVERVEVCVVTTGAADAEQVASRLLVIS